MSCKGKKKKRIKRKKNKNVKYKVRNCPFCDETDLVGFQYYNHMRKHKIRPKCHICNKTFARKDILKNHINVTHNNQPKKKIKCTYCGKKYETNYLYRTHKPNCSENPKNLDVSDMDISTIDTSE